MSFKQLLFNSLRFLSFKSSLSGVHMSFVVLADSRWIGSNSKIYRCFSYIQKYFTVKEAILHLTLIYLWLSLYSCSYTEDVGLNCTVLFCSEQYFNSLLESNFLRKIFFNLKLNKLGFCLVPHYILVER